jgi:hypothetical protein
MIDRVKKLLHELELRSGKGIPWLVYQEQTDPVGCVRVEVYPAVGDHHSLRLGPLDRLTPRAEETISEWFQPLVQMGF